MVYWELKKLEILCCWKKNLEWCNLELTENCFFIFKALGDQILFVNRPDKKKILFFNDKSCQFSVDEGEPSFLLSLICRHVTNLGW